MTEHEARTGDKTMHGYLMKLSDWCNRFASALFCIAASLFIGYMCGAPIVTPDIDNFMPYFLAAATGLLAFIRPWRFGA